MIAERLRDRSLDSSAGTSEIRVLNEGMETGRKIPEKSS